MVLPLAIRNNGDCSTVHAHRATKGVGSGLWFGKGNGVDSALKECLANAQLWRLEHRRASSGLRSVNEPLRGHTGANREGIGLIPSIQHIHPNDL